MADKLRVEEFCYNLKVHRAKVVVIGSPQLDLILDSDQRRRTILKVGYGLYYSIEMSSHLGFQNFLATSEAVRRASDKLDVKVVLRPHPSFELAAGTNAERESPWKNVLKEIDGRCDISMD